MDFLNGQTATNFVIAVAVVGLALIAYAGVLRYLRERPVSPLLAMSGRERAKRLSVIDAAVVDSRRRVVLIRRDNVEHLVLIGGPTDVVIESRIGLEEPSAASAAIAAAAALQRRTEVQDAIAEAPRRAAQQRQASAPRPQQPVPPPANTWEAEQAAAEAEEDTYNYGPNAAFDAKDYHAPQPPQQAYRPEPATPAPEPAKPSAAAVAEANAESIIEMLRSRILNDAAATASLQAARQADASRRQVSTFERLLNERMQANDRQPVTTPRAAQRTAAPAMPGVGPATARASAAAAQQLPLAREIAPEKPRSEVALEMEVARILEELQTRRKQKQNP
ncbi:flagellar biogenesis protein FliO [Rhizobium aquaticum]|uniref:Flagellar biogenesis protein FliO n=1 Tax=Rhizobium aquaticum TaxID=1549636 RepID=A0ABV2IWE1_9HYPH